ncbi:TPA: hypothetical protein N0F65_005711 [Lagenidium giganteum]|uniref:Dicer-like protein 1 n=1 Tax=Lagenidium giganteum TaxID=4803 RepID=A0AAV2Z8U5_9STRA|nr:TPA: hypothetical protein N0F65_005711 [Lagenidium giganteum]
MALWPHQDEVVALARVRNALVCSSDRVGKTYMCSMMAREALGQKDWVVAVVASHDDATALSRQLTRVCSTRVGGDLHCSARSAWQDDDAWLQDHLRRHQLLLLSPRALLLLLRRQVLELHRVALLVVDGFDQVELSAPALFRTVNEHAAAMEMPRPLRVFATTKLSAAAVVTGPLAASPLLQLVQVINLVPAVPAGERNRTQQLAPILCETIDVETGNGAAAAAATAAGTNERSSARDFVLGANPGNIDVVAALRAALTLIAGRDERKKQEKVDRFIKNAELVLGQLGDWCLVKFAELELQLLLFEWLTRTRNDASVGNRRECNVINDSVQATVTGTEMLETMLSAQRNPTNADQNLAKTVLDAISWLHTHARSVFPQGVTQRLLKVSEVVRCHLESSLDPKAVRCRVLVERRCVARVVAEYLNVALADLSLPPPASILGSRHARIAGSTGLSTPTKIVEMAQRCAINVIVTTIPTETADSADAVNLPQSDLIVAMDEIQDPSRLHSAARQACPINGSLVCIRDATDSDARRFSALVARMKEALSIDQNEQRRDGVDEPCESNPTDWQRQSRRPSPSTAVRKQDPEYQIAHRDTGAVLSHENSVACLSAFFDSLPRNNSVRTRPQYLVARRATGRKEASTGSISFDYSAKLQIPAVIGIKQTYSSPTTDSEEQAKGIVAFNACKDLLKRGLLDRRFKSILLDDEGESIHPHDEVRTPTSEGNGGADAHIPDTVYVDEEDFARITNMTDLSTRNTYDLPFVTADSVGLQQVKHKLDEAAKNKKAIMYLHTLLDMKLAVLTTSPLPKRDCDLASDWTFRVPSSTPDSTEVRTITIEGAISVELDKSQLESALNFHLTLTSSVCVTSNEKVIEPSNLQGDALWAACTKQSDKGYLIVPIKGSVGATIDWETIDTVTRQPYLKPMSPLDPARLPHAHDWIVTAQGRPGVYAVVSVTHLTAANVLQNNPLWWQKRSKQESSGENPIIGRWYSRQDFEAVDPSQRLLHCIRLPVTDSLVRNEDLRNVSSPKALAHRLLLPEYVSVLNISKGIFLAAMEIVPLLHELERRCQMRTLVKKIGIDLDTGLLMGATTKPDYERCETIGDTFLKLETSWYLFENRRDITSEGLLSENRSHIVQNTRLNQFAFTRQLDQFISFPAALQAHPFRSWLPSCSLKHMIPVVAPSKWIADVVEALCGAYLIGQGELGARNFLKWVGVAVPDKPQVLARPFYPDCIPRPLEHQVELSECSPQFSVAHFDDLTSRLAVLQTRMNYRFKNQLLLLEAITHSSVSRMILQDNEASGHTNGSHQQLWRGNYERLEYLGDAIIEYLTLSYAFVKHSDWLPGSLSFWKSATVCNDALGKTALACFGVDECIVAKVQVDGETRDLIQSIKRTYADAPVGSSVLPYSAPRIRRKVGSQTRTCPPSFPKMFGDVFEALIAAVFLDSGHDMHLVRDVFLGPLLETVGDDALAFVCRESGLHRDEDLDF